MTHKTEWQTLVFVALVAVVALIGLATLAQTTVACREQSCPSGTEPVLMKDISGVPTCVCAVK